MSGGKSGKKRQEAGLGKSLRGVKGTGMPLPGSGPADGKRQTPGNARGRWVWYLVGALIFTVLWLLVGMSGCASRDSGVPAASDTLPDLAGDAELLQMYECDGYVRVDIVNPWDSAAMLGRYVLVSAGTDPDSLPSGYVRLDVPLKRSIVYSGVHAGLIAELGSADAVAGVADGSYFNTEPFVSRIKSGSIVDVGSSQSPSLEAIVGLKPDAVLASPFENAGHGVIDQTGVPVVECADYMEGTPLGRAEWMKFFGRLYGNGAVADSLYEKVKERYDSVRSQASGIGNRPLVLTEMLTDGYWFVPGGNSYMARMIQDAGGRYPWAADRSRGSLQLDYSSVYARAADADVWLIRSYGRDLSYDDIESVYLLNGQFKAFKDGNVWVANTAAVPLFDEFPFHPDLLLEEYFRIFHPQGDGDGLRYYKRARK